MSSSSAGAQQLTGGTSASGMGGTSSAGAESLSGMGGTSSAGAESLSGMGSTSLDGSSGKQETGAAGAAQETCPTDCVGNPAPDPGPCVVGHDALWTCHGGVNGDYEFISANCQSTGIATPQPQFCCSLDFIPECLGRP